MMSMRHMRMLTAMLKAGDPAIGHCFVGLAGLRIPGAGKQDDGMTRSDQISVDAHRLETP